MVATLIGTNYGFTVLQVMLREVSNYIPLWTRIRKLKPAAKPRIVAPLIGTIDLQVMLREVADYIPLRTSIRTLKSAAKFSSASC